jgi:hypothetical protein
MKKYIYSPQHQGLVLAPLMGKPVKENYQNKFGRMYGYDYSQAIDEYNTWLSSPPIYKVRPEDIEWFSVERGEDEFETLVEFLSHDEKTWMVNIVFTKQELRYVGRPFRTVAIPKNESKEQNPSVEPDFENDPYWIGQAYLQDKQLLEIEKMFDDNGLRLELTCSACPEQYDVFLKVGYLRLRHGEFRVDYPDCGGETIYEAEPNGDGIFNKDERVKYMEEAMKSILKMLNKDHSPTL